MILVTIQFLILHHVNLHRGLNAPNEHLLKLWQVFLGGDQAITAPENHHPMVAHNKNPPYCSVEHVEWLSHHNGQQTSWSLFDGHRWCCNQGCHYLGQKMGETLTHNDNKMGGSEGLLRNLVSHQGHFDIIPRPSKHHNWDTYFYSNWIN